MIGTMLRRLSLVAALAVVTWVGMGCESGGGGDGGGDSSFVGTWAIYDQTSPGSPPWYVNFESDGTYFFSENEGGTEGVSGTFPYTVSDGQLVGPFTNPSAGDGRIEATITDGTLNMDFIEYWHTPNKVVPYTGTKM
jgi:hypothetical protein